MPDIYKLSRPTVAWGDYGDVLAHGFASRSEGGILQLERVGPFVPPISMPAPFVVVNSVFLEELHQSGLAGFSIGEVAKKRIPYVDWRSWEPYGHEEMAYPEDGEPENYIERGEHSPEASERLGDLFELRACRGIDVSRDGGFHLVAKSWNGQDFFTASDEWVSGTFVSERARQWLMAKAPEWVAFEPRTAW